MERSSATFDWNLYADATFAGLSVLIPIPLLDLAFEQFFRRRMPRTIARHRNRQLSPAVLDILNRWGCGFQNCLLLFPWLIFQLVKRLSRKILYFLTVKDASDTLSRYWHRAFLLDYALRAGHLDDVASAQAGHWALEMTLDSAGTSPLTKVARQVVRQSRHRLGRLWRAARGRPENIEGGSEQATLSASWDAVAGYLDDLAKQYEATYTRLTAGAGPDAPDQ